MADYKLDPAGPLKTQEIRLLEIYPSTDANQELRCRLFRLNLDAIELHPYEALSYVWGDKKRRADISCNGQIVSVTVNLFDALRRLRLRHKPRVIWADAICIDQESDSEKSCQVPLMGKLYSSAERVVVWLGKNDLAEAEGALISVKLMANHLRKVKEENVSKDYLEVCQTLQMPSDYTSGLTQEFLRCLYDKPWFSRVWCMQEIILARDSVMLWGELELSWTDVGEIATWLRNAEPVRALEFENTAFYADIECENANTLFAIRQRRHGLLDTLNDGRSFHATDLRDKVYGMLALVEPAEEARALTVDYDKDVGEVYADVVIAEIRSHSTLAVLAYVDHKSEYCSEGNFNSWVPLWDDPLGGPRHVPCFESSLSACGDVMVELTDAAHLNSQYLRLKGYFYNKISTVHTNMDLDYMQNQEARPFRDIVFTVLIDPRAGAEIATKLARTLTAGSTSEMKDISDAAKEEKRNFYASFLFYIRCLVEGIDFFEVRKNRQPPENFYDEAEIVCSHRRFFQMENGSFGIGPACMRNGDVVVVLFGGESPYVLRPCGRSYLFMGQAYVDELMEGQLIDAMKAGQVQEREFFLV
ncbi:HET-domain-containing protein [Pyrenochaeta sp. DS3sAY3a]|nr:HET-domain-containing protein [Pyrenochaeta sp. DS3sAY3a]